MIKEDVYDISVKIYLTFSKRLETPLRYINHSKKTKEKYFSKIPSKFTDYSRETLIVINLYLNFYKKPKSINSLFEMFSQIDNNELYSFKQDIKNYKTFLLQDYKYTKDNQIKDINTLFNLFIQKKIKALSLYYILKKFNLENQIKSRIFMSIYKDIKILLLFLRLK